MAKKVLAISTSFRKGGNSDRLMDAWIQGAEENGNTIEKIYLSNNKIEKCRGCLACQKIGHCVIKDDMTEILTKMQDAAAQQGFQVIAGVAAVAQHSMLSQYATGRPDKGDESTLEKFSTQILEKLQAGDTTPPNMPGNRPYKKAGGGLVPAASSACKNCGLCVEKCPVGAIDPKNPRITDKSKCIGCMRCVAICPEHARSVNKWMLAAAVLMLKKNCSERKENQLFL